MGHGVYRCDVVVHTGEADGDTWGVICGAIVICSVRSDMPGLTAVKGQPVNPQAWLVASVMLRHQDGTSRPGIKPEDFSRAADAKSLLFSVNDGREIPVIWPNS